MLYKFKGGMVLNIRVNGKAREVLPGTTVSGLLAELGLESRPVVVELNNNIIEKADFASLKLTEDDVVEIVQFVGGG